MMNATVAILGSKTFRSVVVGIATMAGVDNLVGLDITSTMKHEVREGISSAYYNNVEEPLMKSRGYVRAPEPQTNDIQLILGRAAEKKHLSFCVLRAFAKQESTFNPNVWSDQAALGLMQIQPDTAKRYCQKDAKDHEMSLIQCLANAQCNADCAGSIISTELPKNDYNLAKIAQIYFNGSVCDGAKCPKTSRYWREVMQKIATDPTC